MVRIPATPPRDWLDLLSSDDERLLPRAVAAGRAATRYWSWDKLRHQEPPEGLTHEQWWAGIKLSRFTNARKLPLLAKDGSAFTYVLTDEVLRAVDEISTQARGTIEVPELVTNEHTRDRYLISSLMEEAITSSQLEGAATTRRVARELLRTQRAPRDRSERMILNNYRAMQFVREHLEEPLTPALVLTLHTIVSAGTLDNPDAAGRLQPPGEERVGVWAHDQDDPLHVPPPAEELPERLKRLCDFANGPTDDEEGTWLPPLLRAVITHFMVGYDHYFEDGNGRTARALFYWVALRKGFWLLEFTTISRILHDAPAQYARAYLHTETDGGDVTYFVLYQLRVIQRAIAELHQYLARKMNEAHTARTALAGLDLNHRQTAIVEGAVRGADRRFTAKSHAESHNITLATARSDLRGLQALGLLESFKEGRAEVWRPTSDLTRRLTVNFDSH